MARLKDFGKSENDLGVWFPFGEEDPPPFEVRVRRIPSDVATRLSKRYGREVMTVVDGIRKPHIERTLDEQTKHLLDIASWAWVDSRGLQIEVCDEEGARLWTGLLKREVKTGDVLDLSGNDLTAEVKSRVLTQIRPYCQMTDSDGKKERVELAAFLVLKAHILAQEAGKAEEEARGNS